MGRHPLTRGEQRTRYRRKRQQQRTAMDKLAAVIVGGVISGLILFVIGGRIEFKSSWGQALLNFLWP
jgi:hypothetical protein